MALSLHLTTLAQSDTVYIGEKFRKHHFPPKVSYFESGKISEDSALLVFLSENRTVQSLEDPNFGIVSDYFWFMTNVKNETNKSKHLFFIVAHPHLKRIGFYEIDDRTITRKYETGYQYAFYQRAIPHRYFIFDISVGPNENKPLMLLVDHQNSLDLPLSLWDRDLYTQEDYKTNMLYGAGLGFILFCALFTLAGAIILSTKVFVWYFFYLLAVLLYGFTEPGFAAQFLYPSMKNFDGPFSIHTSLYPFIFLIRFSQALLLTKKNLTLAHHLLNYIFGFLVLMVVSDLTFGASWHQYSIYFLPIVFAVILIGLILLAYCGIKSLKYNRPVALLFLSGSGMVILSAILTIPNQVFGFSENWSFNPVLIGYLLEVSFLSVALIVQYRQVQVERSRLLEQVSEQQQQMYQNYIDGIEKERTRIAGELHDDIGSRLSNLKRGLHQNTDSTSIQLDEIIEGIRQLSHDLAPPVAHVSGLMPLAERLIVDARQSSGIDIKLQKFSYEERLHPAQIHQVYRILQEAIHNIIKHSQATRADVQFFGYDDEFVITIEDNGKGFTTERRSGMGLTQMKLRTERLKGKIEISGNQNDGCHIVITIPFIKPEICIQT